MGISILPYTKNCFRYCRKQKKMNLKKKPTYTVHNFVDINMYLRIYVLSLVNNKI